MALNTRVVAEETNPVIIFFTESVLRKSPGEMPGLAEGTAHVLCMWSWYLSTGSGFQGALSAACSLPSSPETGSALFVPVWWVGPEMSTQRVLGTSPGLRRAPLVFPTAISVWELGT